MRTILIVVRTVRRLLRFDSTPFYANLCTVIFAPVKFIVAVDAL